MASSASPLPWSQHKTIGVTAYSSSDFPLALSHFSQALSSTPPPSTRRELAALHSNMTACHLHLKSDPLPSALAAVKADPKWAKSHLRLAEAHSFHKQSNAACNSCQQALSLDRTCEEARRLLIREMRKRDGGSGRAESEPAAGAEPATPSAPPPPPVAPVDSTGSPSFTASLLPKLTNYWIALPASTQLTIVAVASVLLTLLCSHLYTLSFSPDHQPSHQQPPSHSQGGSSSEDPYESLHAKYSSRSSGAASPSPSPPSHYPTYETYGPSPAPRASSQQTGFLQSLREVFFSGSGGMTLVGMGAAMVVGNYFGMSPFQIIMMGNMMNGGGGGMYYGGGGMGGRGRRRGGGGF